MLISGAITGQLTLGLAVALVRRARVIFWILVGFVLGWRYAFRAKIAAAEITDAAEAASGEGDGSLRRSVGNHRLFLPAVGLVEF